MVGSRGGGGTGGPDPPPPPHWNCQIINFCHVEIFRQTPSGNLDPPPRKFSGSAHAGHNRVRVVYAVSSFGTIAGLFLCVRMQ